MNDPKRWLDKPNDVLSLEQRLLKSGKSLKPPVGAEDRAWSEFRALVGGGVGLSGHAHSGGSASLGTLASTATKAGITKLTVTVVAVFAGGSLAILGNHWMARSKAPLPVSTTSFQTTSPRSGRPEPSLPEVLPVASFSTIAPSLPAGSSSRTIAHSDQPPTQTEQTPPPMQQLPTNDMIPGGVEPIGTAVMPNLESSAPSSGSFPATERPRLSELRAEATSIAQAKNLISAGQFQAALSVLAQIGQRFPAGVLAPEREALTIEALAGAGALPSAQRRAALFLTKYPQSPLSDQIRKFAGQE